MLYRFVQQTLVRALSTHRSMRALFATARHQQHGAEI